MITNSALVGVKQVKPAESLNVEAILGGLGSNSGNMMFTESLYKILPDTRLISWQISDHETKGRDAIIFAAANWLATGADFGHMAEKIEKVDLPVYLIGVGAQSGLGKKIPKLSSGTLRFLSVVAERSKSISTRGDFTCEVLEHYGFKNSIATGCPSLLLAGAGGPKFSKDASSEKIVIHGTRHGFNRTDEFQDYFYKQALNYEYDILLQSETPDILLSKDLVIPADKKAQAYDALEKSYGVEDHTKIMTYLRKHGKFFSDYVSWLDYAKTCSFCMGTRIHGTIASIIAGTPALLIAHDSRTQELAMTMGVPYILQSDVNTINALEIEKFIGIQKELTGLHGYQNYLQRFKDFFTHNNLKVNYL